MKKTIFSLILFALALSACKKQEKSDNPFFSKYDTPFEVPPFDKIKTSHYMPAFIKGMEEQKKEIRAIITNTDQPLFENTIKPFVYSGELLQKVSSVFYALSSANTNDSIQVISREIAPLQSMHRDDINMNDMLFKRIKAVYDNREKYTLTAEEKKIIDDTYKGFIRSGAALTSEDKLRLRKINGELSMLSVKFGQNLLAETNAFKLVIDSEDNLSGLPQNVRDQAASMAKNLEMKDKWVFTLDAPSITPFLQLSDKRDLRQKLYTAYCMRGDNGNDKDNKLIISRIAMLRTERAQLLGYRTHADYVLEEAMAKSPERVFDFLKQIWEVALPFAKAEADAEQQVIDREKLNFKLQPWDWAYYGEKIRKEKYDFDIQDTRQYFKIENVMDGMFYVANRLYGLEFTRSNDIPKYHPDVNTIEVRRNGQHVGILLIDNFPRPSKRGGAWCGVYRSQHLDLKGNLVHPIVTIVTNSTAPTPDKPSLLGPGEVRTLFHEFGHALNFLLSSKVYPAGSQPRDFVELSSQIMEHWVSEPDVLKVYAKHYQTGEVIPGDMVEKLIRSQKFNIGFQTVQSLAASLLDMEYHSLKDTTMLDIPDFENRIMAKYGLIPEIKLRTRSTYFYHIWNSGYSAGYYGYTWCDVLDSDAYLAFKETGDIFNREIAAKFEKEILSKNGSGNPLEMYIAFRGKEPGIDALLVDRGFKK